MVDSDAGESGDALQTVRELVALGDELKLNRDFGAAVSKYLEAADLCAALVDLEPLRVSWQFAVRSPLPKDRDSALYVDRSDGLDVRAVRLDSDTFVFAALASLEREEPSFHISGSPTCGHALAVCRAKAGVALALANPEEAIAEFGRARECFALLDRADGVAACSYALGLLLRESWRYELAIEEFGTAHRLFDLVVREDRVADCLLEMSGCLAVVGWYREAERVLGDASAALEAQGRWTEQVASRLLWMAETLFSCSHDEPRLCDAALCLLPTLRAAFVRSDNEDKVAKIAACDAASALCHLGAGHLDEARQSCWNASALFDLLESPEEAERFHRWMARGFRDAGCWADAAVAYERRRTVSRGCDPCDDPYPWSRSADKLVMEEANCLRALGRHADALELLSPLRWVEAKVGSAMARGCLDGLDEALRHLDGELLRVETPTGGAPASLFLEGEGGRLRKAGRVDEALVAFHLAHRLCERVGDGGGEARVAVAMARMLAERGELDAALALCDRTVVRVTAQSPEAFKTGSVRWDDSEPYLSFTEEGGSASREALARLHHLIAELCMDMGETEDAIAAYRQAAVLAVGRLAGPAQDSTDLAEDFARLLDISLGHYLHDRYRLAIDSLFSCAELLNAGGRCSPALEVLEEALALAQEIGDNCTVARCECRTAGPLHGLGEALRARDCLKRAEALVEAGKLPADQGVKDAAVWLGFEEPEWRDMYPRERSDLRLEIAKGWRALGERDRAVAIVKDLLRGCLMQDVGDDDARECVEILREWGEMD